MNEKLLRGYIKGRAFLLNWLIIAEGKPRWSDIKDERWGIRSDMDGDSLTDLSRFFAANWIPQVWDRSQRWIPQKSLGEPNCGFIKETVFVSLLPIFIFFFVLLFISRNSNILWIWVLCIYIARFIPQSVACLFIF